MMLKKLFVHITQLGYLVTWYQKNSNVSRSSSLNHIKLPPTAVACHILPSLAGEGLMLSPTHLDCVGGKWGEHPCCWQPSRHLCLPKNSINFWSSGIFLAAGAEMGFGSFLLAHWLSVALGETWRRGLVLMYAGRYSDLNSQKWIKKERKFMDNPV